MAATVALPYEIDRVISHEKETEYDIVFLENISEY